MKTIGIIELGLHFCNEVKIGIIEFGPYFDMEKSRLGSYFHNEMSRFLSLNWNFNFTMKSEDCSNDLKKVI